MADERPPPQHKPSSNFLNTAFPSVFGRDSPKLVGVNKSTDFDPDTFQRRSSSTAVAEQPRYDPTAHHDTKTALDSSAGHGHGDRRTPEEEQAYLASLAEWARDKDAIHAGDGTFGAARGWAAQNAGNSQGLMIGAVGDEQFQRDTTVRRKDGSWDVPESKDSGMGFVDTWKRRLSGQSFKERRSSADARAAEWEREHRHEKNPEHGPAHERGLLHEYQHGPVHELEHGRDPISRLKDEE